MQENNQRVPAVQETGSQKRRNSAPARMQKDLKQPPQSYVRAGLMSRDEKAKAAIIAIFNRIEMNKNKQMHSIEAKCETKETEETEESEDELDVRMSNDLLLSVDLQTKEAIKKAQHAFSIKDNDELKQAEFKKAEGLFEQIWETMPEDEGKVSFEQKSMIVSHQRGVLRMLIQFLKGSGSGSEQVQKYKKRSIQLLAYIQKEKNDQLSAQNAAEEENKEEKEKIEIESKTMEEAKVLVDIKEKLPAVQNVDGNEKKDMSQREDEKYDNDVKDPTVIKGKVGKPPYALKPWLKRTALAWAAMGGVGVGAGIAHGVGLIPAGAALGGVLGAIGGPVGILVAAGIGAVIGAGIGYLIRRREVRHAQQQKEMQAAAAQAEIEKMEEEADKERIDKGLKVIGVNHDGNAFIRGKRKRQKARADAYAQTRHELTQKGQTLQPKFILTRQALDMSNMLQDNRVTQKRNFHHKAAEKNMDAIRRVYGQATVEAMKRSLYMMYAEENHERKSTGKNKAGKQQLKQYGRLGKYTNLTPRPGVEEHSEALYKQYKARRKRKTSLHS